MNEYQVKVDAVIDSDAIAQAVNAQLRAIKFDPVKIEVEFSTAAAESSLLTKISARIKAVNTEINKNLFAPGELFACA